MELSTVHSHYPLWIRLALAATAIFGVFGMWFVRRVRYPTVLCILPLLGNATVSFVGLERIVDGVSLVGHGRSAAAAGCAEAQGPVLAGAVVSLLLAAVLVLRPVVPPLWHSRERKVIAVVRASVVVLICGDVMISRWLVAPGRQFADGAHVVARAFFWFGLIALLASCTLAFLPRRTTEALAPLSRVPFVVVGSVALILFALISVFRSWLQNIALGL